jgi:hypothetical protein
MLCNTTLFAYIAVYIWHQLYSINDHCIYYYLSFLILPDTLI